MTRVRRSLVLATSAFLDLVPLCTRAETLGWHRIWTTETPGRDAVVRALTLGLATRRIEVATGIAYAFTRAPLAMAATAADANLALGGRFSLGLGAGTRGMRERWYDVDDFDRPASRLAEYAALLRTAWEAEESVAFDGRFYRADYDQLDGSRPRVPIWGSGVNATMLMVAARHFDGVAVHPLAAALPYLDAVAAPAMAEGMAGRPSQPEVACWRLTAIGADGPTARQTARRSLAFYFSTPSYGIVAEATGWGDTAEAIRSGYTQRGPDWDALGRLVPDGMLADFALCGTPGEVSRAWRDLEPEYARRGVGEIVFQPAAGGDPAHDLVNLGAVVELLGPEATGE